MERVRGHIGRPPGALAGQDGHGGGTTSSEPRLHLVVKGFQDGLVGTTVDHPSNEESNRAASGVGPPTVDTIGPIGPPLPRNPPSIIQPTRSRGGPAPGAPLVANIAGVLAPSVVAGLLLAFLREEPRELAGPTGDGHQ